MAAKVRIMADSPDEAAEIHRLIALVLDVAGGDRDYANRSGFGVRRYLDVRVPANRSLRAAATRADRPELE